MGLAPLSRIDGAGSRQPSQSDLDRNETLRTALAGVRALNARGIPGREFAIVRDPDSHRFVLRVVDRATGEVVDQFPPEEILRMLSQFSAAEQSTKGSGE
jgi:hypothetical protein